ncbi:ATP-grasp domain-containing protein [Vibrio campbellii]|uniref:ATP-grasp domain-containing protein n=1 Tax=Vibrio campbellii TaxID=680 RepID=UPI003F8254B8
MMCKKVMILGAGIYQLPLIQKSKELGHKTIVVSPRGDYPGIDESDIFLDINTTDIDSVFEAAKLYDIDAILTTGTDVAVPSIGFVVDELGLKGTSYQSALKSMDKSLMKEAFKDGGVPTAKFGISSNLAEAKQLASSIGFPLMVKASDSSGSRGVYKVEELVQLELLWKAAKDVSRNSLVVMEEFLDGVEFGAQAIIVDGTVIDIIFHNDTVTPAPNNAPLGHSVPCSISTSILSDAEDIVKRAIEVLGIDNTVSNVDLMLVGGKPYIIEIGARMGATCLPENVENYLGIDIYGLLLDIALGKPIVFNPNTQRTANAARLLCAPKSGQLVAIDIPDELTEHHSVIRIKVDKKPGDTVNEFKVGPDRIGEVIVTGGSYLEAEALAEDIAKQIKVHVI